jgi:hypothetical protein
MIHTDRAFVFVRKFNLDIVQSGAEWWISVDWENSGNTPAKDFFNRVNCKTFITEPGNEFGFPDQPGNEAMRCLVGPKAIESSAILKIPISVINGVREKKRRLFVWGWAEYDDRFNKTEPHRTEFCDEVIIDPSGIPIRRLYRLHNGADGECYHKPRQAKDRYKPIEKRNGTLLDLTS